MNLERKKFNSAQDMEDFINSHNLFNIHRRELDNGEFELDFAEMPDYRFDSKGRFRRPDNRAHIGNGFGKYK